MKILVTGAKGFIGRNLTAELRNQKYPDILGYHSDSDTALLDEYCKDADFVFHLAGINRPENESEYMEGNYGFTSTLLETLKKHRNTCPVVFSSSVQAAQDNSYGKSKKAGEELLLTYRKETGADVYIYRFSNVFGKWCRPNYNSAVATFCHNIASGLPIKVNDPDTIINLAYIDDVVEELIRCLNGSPNKTGGYCAVPVVYPVRLGEIAALIQSFNEARETLQVPDVSDGFAKKLYSTYVSYLPQDQYRYPLKMNADCRGSFTEFIKTPERGQISVNISKPGVTKGNHWHHTKCEKFLAVSGKGMIRLRKMETDEIAEYSVSGEKLEVVDIPPGSVHSIENLGDTDLVMLMWVNEVFDPAKPDTYFEEV